MLALAAVGMSRIVVIFFHGRERMVCCKPTGVCKEIHQEDQQWMLLGDLTMFLVWPANRKSMHPILKLLFLD
eukprot:13366557-Ditylum_brightwellii.AAC.1